MIKFPNDVEWIKFAETYLDIINNKFSGLNLTAIKSVNDLYVKQIIDSIAPVEQVPEILEKIYASKYIIDLGTGGGFPLLPLAHVFRDKILVGVDARLKKLNAVEAIAADMNLKNIKIIHANFNQIHFDLDSCIFVSKAVGKIADIVPDIFTDFDSEVLFYKGANFYELEVEDLKKLKNNEQLLKTYPIKIEGLGERFLAQYKIRKNVPRGTRQLKIFSQII